MISAGAGTGSDLTGVTFGTSVTVGSPVKKLLHVDQKFVASASENFYKESNFPKR